MPLSRFPTFVAGVCIDPQLVDISHRTSPRQIQVEGVMKPDGVCGQMSSGLKVTMTTFAVVHRLMALTDSDLCLIKGTSMGTIQPREVVLFYAPRVILTTLKTAVVPSPFASGREPRTTPVDCLSACRRYDDFKPILHSPPPILSGPLNLPPPYKRTW